MDARGVGEGLHAVAEVCGVEEWACSECCEDWSGEDVDAGPGARSGDYDCDVADGVVGGVWVRVADDMVVGAEAHRLRFGELVLGVGGIDGSDDVEGRPGRPSWSLRGAARVFDVVVDGPVDPDFGRVWGIDATRWGGGEGGGGPRVAVVRVASRLGGNDDDGDDCRGGC